MQAAAKNLSKKAPSTFARCWNDPGAYPLILVIGAGGGACGYQSLRYLSSCPQVSWDRTNRSKVIRDNHEEGKAFTRHPFKNPLLNQNPAMFSGYQRFSTERKHDGALVSE
jgi:hypothetical protein